MLSRVLDDSKTFVIDKSMAAINFRYFMFLVNYSF